MRTDWLNGAHGAPYGFMDKSCRINRHLARGFAGCTMCAHFRAMVRGVFMPFRVHPTVWWAIRRLPLFAIAQPATGLPTSQARY